MFTSNSGVYTASGSPPSRGAAHTSVLRSATTEKISVRPSGVREPAYLSNPLSTSGAAAPLLSAGRVYRSNAGCSDV